MDGFTHGWIIETRDLALKAREASLIDDHCVYRGHKRSEAGGCEKCGATTREVGWDAEVIKAAQDLRCRLTPDAIVNLCEMAMRRAAGRFEVTPLRLKILRVLDAIGSVRASELGRMAGIKGGSVHTTMKRIEEAGMVSLGPKREWRITADGKRAIKIADGRLKDPDYDGE